MPSGYEDEAARIGARSYTRSWTVKLGVVAAGVLAFFVAVLVIMQVR